MDPIELSSEQISRQGRMRSNVQPYLTVRVDPNEMVQYVHDLMTTPRSKAAPDTSAAVAQAQWGGDTALARAGKGKKR